LAFTNEAGFGGNKAIDKARQRKKDNKWLEAQKRDETKGQIVKE
jgi:hypothetical protein